MMTKHKARTYIDVEQEEIADNRIFINDYNQHRLMIMPVTDQVGHEFKLLFDLTTDDIKSETVITKLQQSQNQLDLAVLDSSEMLVKELLGTDVDRLYYDQALPKPLAVNITSD